MAATTLSDRPRPATVSASLEARVLDAALRCVARWGVAKTTLDDVAREAGCSRATIYRVFPGGKDTLLLATFAAEIAAYFDDLAAAVAEAATLEDALVVALSVSCRDIQGDPALRYLVEREPEAIMPYLSFDGLDPLLDWARAFAVPQLTRFLAPAEAEVVGEWMARVIISYGFEPDRDLTGDLADPAVARRFVRTYILPGLRADAAHPADPTTPDTVVPEPPVTRSPTATPAAV